MEAPRIIAFNLAILAGITSPGASLLSSSAAIGQRYPSAKPILDRVAAVVLGALGTRLLFDR